MSAAAVDEGLSFLHALPERPVGVSVPVIVSLASSVFLSYGFFFCKDEVDLLRGYFPRRSERHRNDTKCFNIPL